MMQFTVFFENKHGGSGEIAWSMSVPAEGSSTPPHSHSKRKVSQ